MRDNPERQQDRAEDLLDNWRKHRYVMFPQQRRIYEQLTREVNARTVLEAGCGSGQGTALLWFKAQWLVATDKLLVNANFAKSLYPWIEFQPWDVTAGPFDRRTKPGWKAQVTVAVEMIEHLSDVRAALQNLWDSCTEELWLSTPNGAGKPHPPSNPYHVREYSPQEMLAMLALLDPKAVQVLGWEDFNPQPLTTLVDPLVYRVIKRQAP